jgi:hypothetical protein
MQEQEQQQKRYNLLPGAWITFRYLAHGTTAEQMQQLIAYRTGITLPLERITMTGEDRKNAGAIVSFSHDHVAQLLQWALCEDTVNGSNVDIGTLTRKRT